MLEDLFRRKIRYVEVAVFLMSFILVGILLQVFSIQWWLYFILVPVILLGSHYYKEIGLYWRIILVGSFFGIITRSILRIVRIIAVDTANPPEWDFLTFWLDGKIAVQGLNFYLPTYYLNNNDLPVNISQGFISQILKVGFRYPPPTILLFFPLGWFDSINYAYLSWQLLMAATIGISIFFLWKLFLDKDGVLGLLVSGALVLLFPATYSTLGYAQTNFLVLLAILLFIYYSEHFSGGMWLGVGFMIKPFVGLLFLFSVIQRQWRTVIGSIVMYGFLSLVTIVLFGLTTFNSYFTERPVSKMPDVVYTEGVNQSLLAQILRLTNYDFTGKSPLFNPIFILITIFLLTATCLLTFFMKKADSIWALALTLLTALLIYPGTLTHYSVLLIIPIFILWKYRSGLPVGHLSSILVMTATYLFNLKDRDYIFLAIILNWFVFATIGSWKVFLRFSDFRRTSQTSSIS